MPSAHASRSGSVAASVRALCQHIPFGPETHRAGAPHSRTGHGIAALCHHDTAASDAIAVSETRAIGLRYAASRSASVSSAAARASSWPASVSIRSVFVTGGNAGTATPSA